MNLDEHYLTILVEECNEVAYHASKALRFGLDDKDPRTLLAATEQKNIERELYHVLAMIEILAHRGILPPILDEPDRSVIEEKKDKVAHFLKYARKRGTLQ